MAIIAPVFNSRDRKRGALKSAAHIVGYAPSAVKTRRLRSAQQVRHAVTSGRPVLLAGRMPAFKPRPDGYWMRPDPTVEPFADDAVALIDYSPKRKAYRVIGAHGIAWGQLGRAWMPEYDVVSYLVTGDCTAEEVSA